MIVEVGPKVKGFKKGDRVAYCGVLGAYCQERLMGVEQLVQVPKGVSDEQAAAIMLKGMTTEYLVDHCAKPWLKKGDIVLFHAAAGGVGLLFGQWAKARGYKVIGTVSSPEKAALAKKNGYKWVIDYTKENVVEKVKEITKGKGVPVVFDGVGKDTWEASLDCLQPRGLMASFGNASGAGARRSRSASSTPRARSTSRGRASAPTPPPARISRPVGQVAVQDGQERQGEDRHRPALSAGRGGAGPYRSRRPQDHRPDHPGALIRDVGRSAFDGDRRPDRLDRHGQVDRGQDAAADGRAGVRRRRRRPCRCRRRAARRCRRSRRRFPAW